MFDLLKINIYFISWQYLNRVLSSNVVQKLYIYLYDSCKYTLGGTYAKITLGLSKVIVSFFLQGKGGNKPFQSDKPEGFLQVERYDTNLYAWL